VARDDLGRNRHYHLLLAEHTDMGDEQLVVGRVVGGDRRGGGAAAMKRRNLGRETLGLERGGVEVRAAYGVVYFVMAWVGQIKRELVGC
jgi:hypothetical protein